MIIAYLNAYAKFLLSRERFICWWLCSNVSIWNEHSELRIFTSLLIVWELWTGIRHVLGRSTLISWAKKSASNPYTYTYSGQKKYPLFARCWTKKGRKIPVVSLPVIKISYVRKILKAQSQPKSYYQFCNLCFPLGLLRLLLGNDDRIVSLICSSECFHAFSQVFVHSLRCSHLLSQVLSPVSVIFVR